METKQTVAGPDDDPSHLQDDADNPTVIPPDSAYRKDGRLDLRKARENGVPMHLSTLRRGQQYTIRGVFAPKDRALTNRGAVPPDISDAESDPDIPKTPITMLPPDLEKPLKLLGELVREQRAVLEEEQPEKNKRQLGELEARINRLKNSFRTWMDDNAWNNRILEPDLHRRITRSLLFGETAKMVATDHTKLKALTQLHHWKNPSGRYVPPERQLLNLVRELEEAGIRMKHQRRLLIELGLVGSRDVYDMINTGLGNSGYTVTDIRPFKKGGTGALLKIDTLVPPELALQQPDGVITEGISTIRTLLAKIERHDYTKKNTPEEKRNTTTVREARIAAKAAAVGLAPPIVDHEIIRPTHVMEFFEDARDLRLVLKTKPEALQKRSLLLAQAVHRLHREADIIHADLKPENILLRKVMKNGKEEEEVIFIDFGSGKEINEIVPGDERLGYTPLYTPDERLQDDIINEKTDVFALGCIYYEMLTGQAWLQHVAETQGIEMKLETLTKLQRPLYDRKNLTDALSTIGDPHWQELLAGMLTPRRAKRLTTQQVISRLQRMPKAD